MPGPYDQGWRRIVVCASGPSFSADQAQIIERARLEGRCRVIAINTQALTTMPNADALYAADAPWWHEYSDTGPGRLRWSAFKGQRWCSNEAVAKQYGLRFVPSVAQAEGLSRDLGKVNRGGNSLFAGTGLAYLFTPPPTDDEACCIAIVGADMQRTNGRSHNHGDHPRRLANPTAAALKTWAGRFDALARDLKAAGIGVINCSAVTALTCFERVPLEEILG